MHSFSFFSQIDNLFLFLNDFISKNKNRKIDFVFVSEHCELFSNKKMKMALFEEEEGGGLHVII